MRGNLGQRTKEKEGENEIGNRGKRGLKKTRKEKTLENEGMWVLAWLGLIGYRVFRSEKIGWFC